MNVWLGDITIHVKAFVCTWWMTRHQQKTSSGLCYDTDVELKFRVKVQLEDYPKAHHTGLLALYHMLQELEFCDPMMIIFLLYCLTKIELGQFDNLILTEHANVLQKMSTFLSIPKRYQWTQKDNPAWAIQLLLHDGIPSLCQHLGFYSAGQRAEVCLQAQTGYFIEYNKEAMICLS